LTFGVYGIQSEFSGRIYIGQTDSLLQRIEEHNAGRVKFTKEQRPWKIIAIEIFKS
jgi:predicted GIY-YIG superfamily endonuclease